MHRGCFVSTPTLLLSGRRTPCPGTVRVCVCVPLLAVLSSCFARPPPSWGCPSFVLLFAFSLFVVVLFASFAPTVPPLSRAFSGFRPRVLCALALCGFFFCHPPFFFHVSFVTFCRSVLGSLFVAPRPPFPLFISPFLFFFLLVFFSRAFGVAPRPCLFCGSPAARLSMCSRCFCVFCLAFGCSLAAASPPPPLSVARLSSRFRSVSCVFPLLFCSCLLACASRRLSPPPGVRVVPCAVWCRSAALPFRLLFCSALLPCSVLF